MDNLLKVYLLALNTPVVEEEAVSISLPTKEGIITVLPKHTNLITALESGLLVVKKPNKEKVLYGILGGICVISKNEVKIITNIYKKGETEIKEKYTQWESPSIKVDEKFEEEIKLHLLKVIREWKTQKTSIG